MSIHYATIAQGVAAGAAAVAAIFSGSVAYLAWRTSQRAADATKQAADATKQAAVATEAQAAATKDTVTVTADAARAAEASAEATEALTRMELERRHEEMSPDVVMELRWEQVFDTNQHNLVAYLTNRSRRDYRIQAHLRWVHGAVQTATVAETLGIGQDVQVHVGELRLPVPDQQVDPIADQLDNLPDRVWCWFDSRTPCPCLRATDPGRHWELTFAVRPPETPTGRPKMVVRR